MKTVCWNCVDILQYDESILQRLNYDIKDIRKIKLVPAAVECSYCPERKSATV